MSSLPDRAAWWAMRPLVAAELARHAVRPSELRSALLSLGKPARADWLFCVKQLVDVALTESGVPSEQARAAVGHVTVLRRVRS